MMSRRAPALFNWAGSKARVAKALCRLELPTIGTYHEPFLGSGAAFLGLASVGLLSKSFLSDVNPRLVNVFHATQAQPHEVVAGLRMHALLDSDVHFSAVLGRLNSRPAGEMVDCQVAADTIYLLSQSFHSTWYETRDGHVSMSRRRETGTFRARYQDVVRAATLLEEAEIRCGDFRSSLDRVKTGDLVFLDPPYLYGDDENDQHSYNTARFNKGDIQFLTTEMHRLVKLGAYVIFCWGERKDALVPFDGHWYKVGRDHIWLSQALSEFK